MRALTENEVALLSLACGDASIHPPTVFDEVLPLCRAGLLAPFKPELSGCVAAFTATEAGKRALRVHAAYLGSVA